MVISCPRGKPSKQQKKQGGEVQAIRLEKRCHPLNLKALKKWLEHYLSGRTVFILYEGFKYSFRIPYQGFKLLS